MTRGPAAALLALGLGLCGPAGAVGCASSTQRDRAEDFRRSVEGYNEAYRWKNYARAAAFLPAELRSAYVAGYEEDDKSLHVEGYQILEVKPLSEQAAEVRVRYRFLLLPSVTLQTRTVVQHWALVGPRWVLEHEDHAIRPIDRTELAAEEPEGYGGEASVEVEVVGPDGEVVGRRQDGPPLEGD